MEKQTAIRITDDMSHLQFLLDTIGKQRDRALKAEAEVRKLNKDMQELLAERTDLKVMLADAGLRNAVLQKRLYAALDMYAERAAGCPSLSLEAIRACEVRIASCGDVTKQDCMKCWRDYALTRLKEVQP